MRHFYRHKRHSLSARLLWLFIGMAVLFVVLVGGAMSHAFRYGFEETLRPHLVRYLEYIQTDIGSPPDIERAKNIARRIPVAIHIFSKNDTWSSAGTAPDLDAIRYRHRITENGNEYIFGRYREQDYLISKHPDYTLAFSIPNPRNQWHWRLIIPVVVLLFVLILLHYAIRRLFQPIQTLKDGIERIGRGELDHRVVINRKDEFGELAKSVNAMAGDIQQILEAKRHLLLAISHELRSPLTRAKVALELLGEGREQDEVARDLNDMEQLIEELLETERLSNTHRVLEKTQVSFTELIKDLVKETYSGTAIDLELANENITADIDVPRIKLLLNNLIGNALKHGSRDGQPPKLSLSRETDGIMLTVQDYGDGIDEEHLPHLTEPFYRVDPARLRQTGGYGLGLYLCRVIAEAHDGTLVISSQKGKGTRVRVHLPA